MKSKDRLSLKKMTISESERKNKAPKSTEITEIPSLSSNYIFVSVQIISENWSGCKITRINPQDSSFTSSQISIWTALEKLGGKNTRSLLWSIMNNTSERRESERERALVDYCNSACSEGRR